MSMPSVSVVIPVFNDPAGIRECIESLSRQTKIPSEVIVVDNGSEPPIPDTAGLRIVREETPGSYRARNAGLAVASGDITAFTDADEVVIAEIFASRDTDEALRATSAAAVADAVERASGVPAIATGDVDATTTYVAEHLRPGDAVLVMGAGKSYRIARGLAAALSAGVLDAPRSLS